MERKCSRCGVVIGEFPEPFQEALLSLGYQPFRTVCMTCERIIKEEKDKSDDKEV